MKRTTIVDKLGDIAAAIKQRGSANLTRLTVIKKWFEVPSRLSSFAIFIADQASRRKTKTTKEASKLIREARTLLADADVFAPKISRKAATRLHASLRTFQNEQLLARRCSATPGRIILTTGWAASPARTSTPWPFCLPATPPNAGARQIRLGPSCACAVECEHQLLVRCGRNRNPAAPEAGGR